jgi:enoyl-CoA hydratase
MTVRYTPDGPVVVVTIDRPEVANAVDRVTAEALAGAFRSFEADEGLAVAVLAGAGGTFCAGADLKALRDPDRANRLAADGDGPMGPTRMLLSKPVIAAVEGYAVAGGLELAAWCDLRVAAENAVFGVYCRRWGVPLVDGGTIRLSRLVGHSRALDLILTGRGVSGAEAVAMGLVNQLVPAGEAEAAAVALARQLAAFPQGALRGDRMSSYEQWGQSLPDALHTEYRYGTAAIGSGEMAGGLERFAEGSWRAGPRPEDAG